MPNECREKVISTRDPSFILCLTFLHFPGCSVRETIFKDMGFFCPARFYE